MALSKLGCWSPQRRRNSAAIWPHSQPFQLGHGLGNGLPQNGAILLLGEKGLANSIALVRATSVYGLRLRHNRFPIRQGVQFLGAFNYKLKIYLIPHILLSSMA